MQRDKIYKFFYPNDYQKYTETRLPTPGQRRIYNQFDLKISTLKDATLDVLFTKDDIPNAIHINFRGT